MRDIKDILLFSRDRYRKLSGKISTLVLGILFVGIVDVGLGYFLDNYNEMIAADVFFYNIMLGLILIPVLGILDVVFFSIPLFDLFKLFKKEDKPEYGLDLKVKVMKVYIMMHFLVLPVNILIGIFLKDKQAGDLSINTQYILALVVMAVVIWQYAIMTRGFNVIYKFTDLYRKLVFLAVMLWGLIFSRALDYLMYQWIIKLFKL